MKCYHLDCGNTVIWKYFDTMAASGNREIALMDPDTTYRIEETYYKCDEHHLEGLVGRYAWEFLEWTVVTNVVTGEEFDSVSHIYSKLERVN